MNIRVKTQSPGTGLWFFALIAAALMGLTLLFLGETGLAAWLGLFLAFLALYLTWRYQYPALCCAVAVLGLAPFSWGLKIEPLPLIRLDDIIVLTYFSYFFAAYFLSTHKKFSLGTRDITLALIFFLIGQAIVFIIYPPLYPEARNFINTVVLGLIFYVLVYNETEASNIESMIGFIAVTTIVLSSALYIEFLMGQNPLMEKAAEYFYMSRAETERLGGVYRPYLTFFTASEAGTFIAMGLPLVLYKIRRWPRAWYYLILAFLGLALILNYTRGVWLALGLSSMIFLPRVRRIILWTLPFLILAWFVADLYFSEYPFVKRLGDPTNLLIRFFYWDVAADILQDHWFFGVGHGNFKRIYLEFIRTQTFDLELPIKKIFVADNAYLTTLVEHGLVGLSVLLALIFLAIRTLRKLHRNFIQKDDQVNKARLMTLGFGLSVYLLAGLLVDVHLFTKVTNLCFVLLALALSLSKPEPA
ncbi:MAG: O-antigen ligase family protein [Thermodesulfobacteriota bacterium]